jgi:thiol-disulfide isomerase/thioredoxin
MKYPLKRIAVFALAFTASAFCVEPGRAAASDLLSNANIHVYSKPLKMSDLVLKTPTGRVVSLNDYRGRVVLLHFWQIQCPACRMEEPLLDHLKKTFGPMGLEILGVNLTDPPNAILGYVIQNRIPFPVLYDGGQGFSLQGVSMAGKVTAFLVNPAREAILEVPGFPTTYVIDCRGSAVAMSIGMARWDHRSAVTLIQNLVSESKTCRSAGRESSSRYSIAAQ